MKLQKLFDIAIESAIEADPRSKKEIEKALKRVEERHKRAEGKELEHADQEAKKNPYLDSRIIFGTGKEEIDNLMVGIDIETPELLLAHELKKSGTKIDAMMLHHPEGRGLADLEKVMSVQVDVLAGCGVPVNRAEGALRPRIDKIWRVIHADNLFRTEQAAKLLGIPIFNCHTISDHMVWRFMENEICKKKFDSLKDILDYLLEIPEYKEYARKGNPPIIANGNKENRPGRIFATEFTGGTNGPEDLIKLQAEAGVGTILSMHTTDKILDVAKEYHVNIIQCSHMASDDIGLNLLIDRWQKKGAGLKILPISGFVRVDRTKSKKGRLLEGI